MTLDSIADPNGADEALALSKDDVFGLLGTLADGIIVMDGAGIVRFFSAAAARMFGYDPDEIVGQKLGRLMFDEDVARHEAGLAGRRRGKTASKGLLRVRGRRKDGGEIPLEIAIGQTAVHGQTIFLGSLRDISLRKRTEDALRRSEEKFARVFWSSPDSMVLTRESDGLILDFNEQFLALNGYTADEVRGKTALELGLWSVPEKRVAFLKAVKESGQSQREVPYRRPDGTIATVAATSRQLEVDGVACILSITRDITVRKGIEEALRQSEEKFARAFHASPDTLVITRATDGRIIDYNDAFLTNNGLSERDVRGKTTLELGLWAEPNDRAALTKATRERGGLTDVEIRFRRPGGAIRTALASTRLIQVEGVECILFIGRDITDRKLAEDALRTNERRLRDAQRIAHVGNWEFDVDAQRLTFSAEIARIFEAAPGQTESTWDEFTRNVHRDHRERLDGLIAEAIERGQRFDFEYDIYLRGGRRKTIRAQGEVTANPGGGVLVRGTNQDISEQKLAEEALRQSEEKFSKVFKVSPDLILITRTGDGTVVDANEKLFSLTGYRKDEVLGKPMANWVQPEDQAEIRRQLDETGECSEYETRFQHRDGRTFVGLVSARTIQVDGEDCVLSVTRDITERKNAEERLRHASKLEAVGQLTGGIAHDFNNLLTALIGNLQFLGDQISDDPDTRRYLNVSLGAAVRGADLTQRLLAFSRKQVLKPQSTDVNALVDGMTELLARTLGPPIKITPKLAAGLAPALVDANQLESAIINLAINARDAMPDGGQLTIKTASATLDGAFAASEDDLVPGPYISLAVSDTGHGMRPEVLEHALEPFFTTKEVGRGSGLGLSTIFGFIKQTGGQTAVASTPGAGTTVTLYLPLAGARPAPGLSRAAPEEAVQTGTEMILVVEDDPDVQAFVAAVLRHLGYQVEVAADGHQAIELLPNIPTPDLLLTDMVLPGGMDGLKTAREVVRRCPATRVLVVSGHTNRDFLHSRARGENLEFLPKPYTRETLAVRVRKVLDA